MTTPAILMTPVTTGNSMPMATAPASIPVPMAPATVAGPTIVVQQSTSSNQQQQQQQQQQQMGYPGYPYWSVSVSYCVCGLSFSDSAAKSASFIICAGTRRRKKA